MGKIIVEPNEVSSSKPWFPEAKRSPHGSMAPPGAVMRSIDAREHPQIQRGAQQPREDHEETEQQMFRENMVENSICFESFESTD